MKFFTFVRFLLAAFIFSYLISGESIQSVSADQLAKKGDNVTIEYVGSLEDGTVFDSSKNHDSPLEFIVGSGQVISGFDKAIVGMRLMGKKSLSSSLQKRMAREIKSLLIKCCVQNFHLSQNLNREWDS